MEWLKYVESLLHHHLPDLVLQRAPSGGRGGGRVISTGVRGRGQAGMRGVHFE